MHIQRLRLLVLWSIAVLLGTTMAFAANLPTAPNELIVGENSSFNPGNYAPVSAEAYAGNITALVLHAVGQTKAWQGYYGNITATITLDDVNNFTFYNWSEAEPRGEIYASLNNSVQWVGVNCFNFTDSAMNETIIEAYYKIEPDDSDGVPETFNETSHPLLQIGNRNLTLCPTTYIFQNDLYQQTNFVNMLLWDTSDNTSGWIYATMIENKTVLGDDAVCYNNQYCDFQILVNDDGHNTDVSPTVYYFWVELR